MSSTEDIIGRQHLNDLDEQLDAEHAQDAYSAESDKDLAKREDRHFECLRENQNIAALGRARI